MRLGTVLLTVTALTWAAAALAVAFMVQPMAGARTFVSPPVDAARLATHVKKLSVNFYPRSHDYPANLEKTAQYVFDELKEAGAAVTVQPVTVQGERYKNIIARFGPAQGPLMVVGAHYDSHGDPSRGGVSPYSHTPGADDNASGVAGLIELARLLGRTPQARPIELVAYTLEEPPHFRTEHMGSVWHARALKNAGREVRLMVSLEMIGYFSDTPGSQAYPVPGMGSLYPDRGNFIALVGRFGGFGDVRGAKALMAGASDLPVYSVNAPRALPGIDFSDHRSYWDLGYRAMMVTDTAFLRNPNYHRAGDTWDTLDYRRMAKVVQAVYAITQQY